PGPRTSDCETSPNELTQASARSGIVIAQTGTATGDAGMSKFWSKVAILLVLVAVPVAARAEKVLRVVPHADLKIVDPYPTTATITLMHGQMIYDQLFAWNSKLEPKPQMVDHYEI